MTQPFAPAFGSNQVVTAAAATAAVTIDKNASRLRVANTGANKGYFRTFNSAAAAALASVGQATTADMVVPAGSGSTITKDQDHDRLAYISAAGTTLEIMTGNGGV